MSLTFNQFQKELRNRNIDPQVAYCLSIIYEQQVEVIKQVDAIANIVNSLADTVGNVVQLHEITTGRLQELNKMMTGEVHGVHVTTEPGKGN